MEKSDREDETEIQFDNFAKFLFSPKIILGGFTIYIFCYFTNLLNYESG